MSAVYRLRLRDPAHPPTAVIARLRDELPGVEIGANGEALVFMADEPELGAKVRSAVDRVCGDRWPDHFHFLDDDPEGG
ncbi:MAG: hypothetical protein ACJ76S_11930 [Solirubrobacteraceae bacterium]